MNLYILLRGDEFLSTLEFHFLSHPWYAATFLSACSVWMCAYGIFEFSLIFFWWICITHSNNSRPTPTTQDLMKRRLVHLQEHTHKKRERKWENDTHPDCLKLLCIDLSSQVLRLML